MTFKNSGSSPLSGPTIRLAASTSFLFTMIDICLVAEVVVDTVADPAANSGLKKLVMGVSDEFVILRATALRCFSSPLHVASYRCLPHVRNVQIFTARCILHVLGFELSPVTTLTLACVAKHC